MTIDTATEMARIDALARLFAGARDDLRGRLQELRDEQELLRRRRMKGIQTALAMLTATHDELLAAVEANRALFVKPKTRVLHAIKVGWSKQRDELTIANEDETIKRIEALLPDRVDLLVKTTRKPIAAAIAALDEETRTAIGVVLADGNDEPLVKPVDDDLTKLVKALLHTGDDAARAEALVG